MTDASIFFDQTLISDTKRWFNYPLYFITALLFYAFGAYVIRLYVTY